MRRRARFALIAITCTIAARGACAQDSGAEFWRACGNGSPPPEPKRALVYTVSAGFEHDVSKRAKPDELSLVEQSLVDLGRASQFECVPTRDASAFEPESLKKFDLVFFYTTGELPLSEAQRNALFAWVRNGGAFVGAHCATDTFASVPEYGEMIGARFDGHPWHQNVRVNVEDPGHGAARLLDQPFDVTDEIYQFSAPYDRATLHVVLSLDTRSVDAHAAGVHRTDGDFALAWTKPWGKGRVFYTALGHEPDVWKSRRFRTLLMSGFWWAARGLPRPQLSAADEAYRTFAGAGTGDAQKGFAVFRRESGPMCARCHAVNGTGGNVGPDLSSVARRLAPEEIVDSILAPSESIAPAYAAATLELADGTLAFGRVLKEADGVITLADVNGVARAIRCADVVHRAQSRTSVMPDGLARTASREDFADLCAYVMSLKVPAAPPK